ATTAARAAGGCRAAPGRSTLAVALAVTASSPRPRRAQQFTCHRQRIVARVEYAATQARGARQRLQPRRPHAQRLLELAPLAFAQQQHVAALAVVLQRIAARR